ncbi:MAG: ABC transporter permease DevC [Cyanobacteria bacterium J06642_2]
MKTPLAWMNLIHEKTRLLVAIAGVAFAVLLIFMNLGFLGSLTKTASIIYDHLNADVFLVSPTTIEMSAAKTFPRERLYQAAGTTGVERAMSLYSGYQQWRNPETRVSRAIYIYGFNPNDPVFDFPELATLADRQELERPNVAFIDRLSRPEFGPQDTGTFTEVNRRRISIAGQFTMGGGFAADGVAIVSDRQFRRLFERQPLDFINLGLIQLAPGIDPEAMVAELNGFLPEDVEAMTKAQIIERDRAYWIGTTSTGFIFSLGVTVAFTVGTVIVYQILYSDISEHLSEYATLKAMGYRNHYLFGVVLQEAVILAVMGYVPGFALSMGLYEFTLRATNLPISMNLGRAVFVFSLAVVMCALSGLISVRKAMTADPAAVF